MSRGSTCLLLLSDNEQTMTSNESELDSNVIQQIALRVLEMDQAIRIIKDENKARLSQAMGQREPVKREMMGILSDWMKHNKKKRIKVEGSDRYVVLVSKKTGRKPTATKKFHMENVDGFLTSAPEINPAARGLIEEFIEYTFKKRTEPKTDDTGQPLVEQRASIRKVPEKRGKATDLRAATVKARRTLTTLQISGMSAHQLLMVNPDTGSIPASLGLSADVPRDFVRL